jgi:hypothetical protein
MKFKKYGQYIYIHIYILWRIEPLLCNDREMGGYTRVVSGQLLGKHHPAAKNRRATMEILLERGVSAWSGTRSYKEDNWGDRFSSVRESVKRGLEAKAEE